MDHNPYRDFIDGFPRLLDQGRTLSAPRRPFPPRPLPADDAPRVLLLSPHPDDEVITAALPLRLQRQGGCRIVNVAVTLGSRRERRAARLAELQAACDYLGFDLLLPCPEGFEDITPEGRRARPDNWRRAVDTLADIIRRQRPRMIFLPHSRDGHRTHEGTHLLGKEALERQPAAMECMVVETEFWAPLENPNLLVESDKEDVAALVAALSLHAGEVARNPYHLRLPAWMMDNVRRGGELVNGQGAAAPEITFATLYRLGHRRGGEPGPDRGRLLSRQADPRDLFRPLRLP